MFTLFMFMIMYNVVRPISSLVHFRVIASYSVISGVVDQLPCHGFNLHILVITVSYVDSSVVR